MSLRFKILSGFLILAGMLLIAGIWSIIEVRAVGNTVEKILENNYKSITAAKSMKKALEREDNALLLLIINQSPQAEDILFAADSVFESSFKTAKQNITVEGEAAIIDSIKNYYERYKSQWIITAKLETNGDVIDWYFQNLHKSLVKTSQYVDNLLNLNDTTMYQTAIDLKDRSRRAVMPGIVAIIAAIVFTILFNYFVNYYVINPIIQIIKKIRDFTSKRVPFDYQVETNDEISKLTDAVSVLCSHAMTNEIDK